MTRKEFINSLPPECQTIQVQPGKRIALNTFYINGTVWVVLLTNQPGKADMAWKLSIWEWRDLNPKHGTKTRFVRENLPPLFQTIPNPIKPEQTKLPF